MLKKTFKRKRILFFHFDRKLYRRKCNINRRFLEKNRAYRHQILEFHFHRGDFEKWVTETIADKELAEQIKKLQDQNLTGEKLRNQLHLIISKRGGTPRDKTPL